MLKVRTSNDIHNLINFFNTQVGDKTKFITIYFDTSSGAHVLLYWG